MLIKSIIQLSKNNRKGKITELEDYTRTSNIQPTEVPARGNSRGGEKRRAGEEMVNEIKKIF